MVGALSADYSRYNFVPPPPADNTSASSGAPQTLPNDPSHASAAASSASSTAETPRASAAPQPESTDLAAGDSTTPLLTDLGLSFLSQEHQQAIQSPYAQLTVGGSGGVGAIWAFQQAFAQAYGEGFTTADSLNMALGATETNALSQAQFDALAQGDGTVDVNDLLPLLVDADNQAPYGDNVGNKDGMVSQEELTDTLNYIRQTGGEDNLPMLGNKYNPVDFALKPEPQPVLYENDPNWSNDYSAADGVQDYYEAQGSAFQADTEKSSGGFYIDGQYYPDSYGYTSSGPSSSSSPTGD